MVAMTPFVGPLPIGDAHETRQPIRPVERFGEGGVRPSEQLGTHQRAYAVRSPMLSSETTPESSAAVDAILAEAYGRTIEPPTFLNHDLRRRIRTTARWTTCPGAYRP
ncbi:MAG: hypothetical protein GX621_17895 [Pirellulaceae bacterium]|nr:hypothetical protein [Pirellulaceae bacterium]